MEAEVVQVKVQEETGNMKNFSRHIGIFILLLVITTPLVTSADVSISATIIGMTGFFTGLAGMLLNTSIELFVVEMGTNISGGLSQPLNAAWTIVRDLVNLTFIFGLIYVGILTILELGSSSTKKMVASIVIAALLVNFSLFFSKSLSMSPILLRQKLLKLFRRYKDG